MVSYILPPNHNGGARYPSAGDSDRGAAVITAVLVLLGVALLGLSLSGQQVFAHYQQINLDERRLLRQLATEQLFDAIAGTLEMNSRGDLQHNSGSVAHSFVAGGAGQRVLYSEVIPADCPHDFPTLSQCWRIQIRQSGSGFIRERMLITPKTSCAAAYWFPPEGRIVDAPPMPPADTPPDNASPPDPVAPPAPPRPGGLRP